MFERILLENAANGRRRPWTVAVSVLFQCALVGILMLIPMIYTEALPRMLRLTILSPPQGSPAPPEREEPRIQPARPSPPKLEQQMLLAPTKIPDKVIDTAEPTPPGHLLTEGGPIRVPGGTGSGEGIDRILNLIGPRPEPPAQAAKTTNPEPVRKIRVGTMEQAKIISQPKPVYPQLAKQARISGTVRLAAIISEAGNIEELRVLQGHPLLVQAAVDAVQQWRYRPTFLNGVPVKVETTIDVIFTLSQ